MKRIKLEHIIAWLLLIILGMIIIHAPLTVAVGGLARDGKLPMLVGVWAANAVLGLVAVALAWRLVKR